MDAISGIYVITDSQLRPGRSHADIVKAAISGGARIVQMRDKTLSDREFYMAALEVKRLTWVNEVRMFVNDRIDVAAAVGADGVNVGQSDLPVQAVRRVLGKDAIVGVSAETMDEALQAEAAGANYVGFGPVFSTKTKTDTRPASGLELLRQVCAAVKIPVVAIGGIGIDNIAEVAACGAASAAVVSGVVCADDMAAATAELIRRFPY